MILGGQDDPLDLNQRVQDLGGRTYATDPLGYWYSCDCLWRPRLDETVGQMAMGVWR